jgi:hypothetical protein
MIVYFGQLVEKVSQIFGILYSVVKFRHKFGQKVGWAALWVNFFTNSSGHPGFLSAKCPKNNFAETRQ